MKWISVKDKLPDKEGLYLCFDGDDNYYLGDYMLCGEYYQMDDEGNNRKILENNIFMTGDDSGDYKIEVTHWMELPEPPKDNRDD